MKTNNPNLVRDLRNVYLNWVSLLASASPDEDFVETYKLWVLSNSGLSSLTVTVIPLTPVDLVNQMKTSGNDLNAKATWLQACMTWPS